MKKIIKKRMSLLKCGALVFFTSLLALSSSHAAPPFDTIGIPGSWNPVGSGARALGMGGAFIAVADDATAASWNPGGLIQLEKPEVSIVGSYVDRHEDVHFEDNPEGSGRQSVEFDDLNFLSIASPVSLLGYDMVIALNYQKLFDFNRDLSFSILEISEFSSNSRQTKNRQDGEIGAIGLAYAIRLRPNLSVGFTLNFWEDVFGGNEWKENATETLIFTDGTTITVDLKEKNSFSGFNTNIGVLWEPTPNFTIGAILKSPFTADLDVTTNISYSLTVPFLFINQSGTERSHRSDKLEMPMSYGIGMAYRFSDNFTVAFDLYRTEWDDFLLKTSEGKISPITGLSKPESDIDPTTQARLGFEYLFIRQSDAIPLRGGIFYDPAPATGSPDDIYGISLGSGYARGPVIFDIGYQYRWANDIGASPADLQSLKFSHDLEEHTIYTSLILHF